MFNSFNELATANGAAVWNAVPPKQRPEITKKCQQMDLTLEQLIASIKDPEIKNAFQKAKFALVDAHDMAVFDDVI